MRGAAGTLSRTLLGFHTFGRSVPLRARSVPLWAQSAQSALRARSEPLRARSEPLRARSEPLRVCSEPLRARSDRSGRAQSRSCRARSPLGRSKHAQSCSECTHSPKFRRAVQATCSVSSATRVLCISDALYHVTWFSLAPCMYMHGFTLVYIYIWPRANKPAH